MNSSCPSLSKLTLISVSLIFNLLCTVAHAAETDVPFGIRHYDIGAAKNFTLNDIDGEPFELASTKGHWVFLHFWASWCGPCREEMPAIQQLADNIDSEDLQIVMINTAEDEDTIFEFLANIDVELNTLLDPDGMVTEEWKPRGLPTTFLIDPQGKVKFQAIGGREWGEKKYTDFIKRLNGGSTEQSFTEQGPEE
jgi:thiol-disulfide isomerase/thioredoxin